MRPKAFAELWELAVELAPTTESGRRFGPASTFSEGCVGLALYERDGRPDWPATPLNAEPFGSPQVDGDHFSVLRVEGLSVDECPIILTSPMHLGGPWNFVLGENFVDFLALGCRCGYAMLGSLPFDRDQTISEIERGTPDDFEDDERRLLDAIVRRFDLRPWTDVRGRLDFLHSKFAAHIRLSDEAQEWMQPPTH